MPATSLGQAGITWTSQTSAADNSWGSVTYGNGLFVAVATSGTGNQAMTSPDGITWTSQTSALTPTAPVNIFTMKPPKGGAHKITTQLHLPGPGKVVKKATTLLSTPHASSQMAKTARTLTVCTARKTVAKAGKVTIHCHLTAKARAARKMHSLKVRLVTTFTPTGGTAKSVSTTLVLKQTRYRPPPVTG